MSTIQFSVPQEYGYTLLAASSTFILGFIHSLNTGKFRMASGVKFPTPYATSEEAATDPKKYAFNCAQRAHGNYLENQPSVLAATLIAGLQYPVAAAVLGAGWVINRWIYMIGYSKASWGKEGLGRMRGGLSWLCQLALFGLAGKVGVDMVRA